MPPADLGQSALRRIVPAALFDKALRQQFRLPA